MRCDTDHVRGSRLDEHSQALVGTVHKGRGGCWSPRGRPQLSIEVGAEPGVTVVTVHGELDIAGAGPLREFLARLGAHHVVIDARPLTFIDAAGMSVLVIASNQAVGTGGSFLVRGARGEVRRVLDLAGLVHLLDEEAR